MEREGCVGVDGAVDGTGRGRRVGVDEGETGGAWVDGAVEGRVRGARREVHGCGRGCGGKVLSGTKHGGGQRCSMLRGRAPLCEWSDLARLIC